MTKKRLKKGEARIQFLASRERIEELQAKGFDILVIYSALVKEKRISMSYAGFYENITQRRKKNKAGEAPAKSRSAAPKTVSDTQNENFDAFRANLEKTASKSTKALIGRGEDEYSDEELF